MNVTASVGGVRAAAGRHEQPLGLSLWQSESEVRELIRQTAPEAVPIERVRFAEVVIEAVEQVRKQCVPVVNGRISDARSVSGQSHCQQFNITAEPVRPRKEKFRIASSVRNADQPYAGLPGNRPERCYLFVLRGT
jgi:hypothetical protein